MEMIVNIEFIQTIENAERRGIVIYNVRRFEVTLRRDKMYLRVICDNGESRTYDYSEIKCVTIDSEDGSKGWDLVRREAEKYVKS